MSASVTVTYLINGDEQPLALPGDTTLGEAKRIVVEQFSATHLPVRWEVRDARDGFLLNEATVLRDLVERDGVRRVLVTTPVGAGGS